MTTDLSTSPRPLKSTTSKHVDSVPGLILRHAHPPRAEYGVETLQLNESIIRHASWVDRRQAVWEALQACHVSVQRLERFGECGSGLWLLRRASDGHLRMSCNCCRDRWCEPCSASRGRRLADALIGAMSDLGRVRFVTLTLKHRPGPLAGIIDRLYRSFTALRKRPLWADAVRGCAAILEVKIGRDGLWHPHLHVLCDGDYIDQRRLSEAWLAVTGDSSIVDVRLVKSRESIGHYVTKYVSKGCDGAIYAHPDRLQEAILALRSRRLCLTCGTWRGIKLLPPTEQADPQEYDDEGRPIHADAALEWRPFVKVDRLAARARVDPGLWALWHELIARFPVFRLLYDPRVPDA